MNVTFRGVALSEELVHYVRRLSDGVEDRLTGGARCAVVLRDVPPMRGRARRVDVDVEVALASERIIGRHGDPDAFLAIRGAFDDAARKLGAPQVTS